MKQVSSRGSSGQHTTNPYSQAPTVTIIAQVNGKLRNRLELPADATDEDIEAAALADERVQRFIEGKPVRKVIVVPNRLINNVV